MTRLLGRYAVSASLAGVVALAAGCTTGPQPAPPPTTSGVVSPTSPASLPSPSTSASPTSVAYPTDLPAEALANTPEGAVAFVRYFLKAVNRGYYGPTPGIVVALSQPTCRSCAEYQKDFAELADNKRHLDREPFTVTEITVISDTSPGAVYSVDAVIKQNPARVIDATGGTHDTWAATTGVLVVDLIRDGERWTVNEVQVRG